MVLTHYIFRSYAWYYFNFPVQRGKEFVARVLDRCLGETIVRVGAVKFWVGVRSRLDREILYRRTHDQRVIDVLRRELKPGRAFLDVGANCGYFSVLANIELGARVFAFEPSTRELRRLFMNLALNSCGEVTVFPTALGAEYSMRTFHLADVDNPGMNSLVDLRGVRPYVAEVSVLVGRLQDFVAPPLLRAIAVVKIDVEGFEMEVLRGLECSMQHLGAVIFVVEVTPSYLARAGAKVDEIYQFFTRHGFEPELGKQASPQWDEVFKKTVGRPAEEQAGQGE